MPHNAIVPEDVRWLLLDRGRPQYASIRAACSARHQGTAPGNNFSEVLSDDTAQSLVKIAGADQTWRDDNAISNPGRSQAILDVYDMSDHGRAASLLATDPNWTNTRFNDGEGGAP